jgi:hypothetical protein
MSAPREEAGVRSWRTAGSGDDPQLDGDRMDEVIDAVRVSGGPVGGLTGNGAGRLTAVRCNKSDLGAWGEAI